MVEVMSNKYYINTEIEAAGKTATFMVINSPKKHEKWKT